MKDELKPVILKDASGAKYTLEFNRAILAKMDEEGFQPENIPDKPFVHLPKFFHYAFLMHHPDITEEETDAFIDKLGGLPQVMINRLVELYRNAVLSLFYDELEEGTQKNAEMTFEL